jgi:hypothetical protein
MARSLGDRAQNCLVSFPTYILQANYNILYLRESVCDEITMPIRRLDPCLSFKEQSQLYHTLAPPIFGAAAELTYETFAVHLLQLSHNRQGFHLNTQ